jgi:hypothetical protein
MIVICPDQGPGYFRWSTGAWFGGQLGGTSWLLVGAAVLAPRAPLVAVVWFLGFAIANALGVWLWWRRDRIRAHPALQLLLLVCGITGVIAWAVLEVSRPDVVRSLGWPSQGHRMLLIVPGLMAWFTILEYGTRIRSRTSHRA